MDKIEETQEELKPSFYREFKIIHHKYLTFCKDEAMIWIKKLVAYLEKSMIHPRIINQFNQSIIRKISKRKRNS